MPIADPGGRTGDGEVTVEEELEATCSRHPVHQGHHRDGQRAQSTEDPMELAHEAGEPDRIALESHVRLEVTPGAERGVRPR